MIKKSYINFVLLFFFFNTHIVFADTINITSEKLEVERSTGQSVFIGDVYAEDDTTKTWSDKLLVNYDEHNEIIISIEAMGKVRIIRNDLEAFGDYSRYLVKNEELMITGNVTVNEGENKINCDKLIIDLRNSKSIMLSDNKTRVKAFIKKNNND